MRDEWIVESSVGHYRVVMDRFGRPPRRGVTVSLIDDPVKVVESLVYFARGDAFLERQVRAIYRAYQQEFSLFAPTANPAASWNEVEYQLTRATRSGTLSLERLPRPRLRHAPVEKLIDIPPPRADPPPPKPEEEVTTWFEVTFVDERGEPVDGLEVTFTHGEVREKVDTNVSGVARWEQTVSTSFANAMVMDVSGLRETLCRRWEQPREGDVLTTEDGVDVVHLRLGEPLHIILSRETPKCISIQPLPVTQVRLRGMFFETNKTFLLPAAFEGIRYLKQLYDRFPDAEVLVVGHTDSVGTERDNAALSLKRAQAVAAYLQDDVDAWCGHYDESGASARWGSPEDLHMLSALPHGEPPYFSLTHDDPSFEGAAKRFQEAAGLVVDGIVGPKTREALVRAYMEVDGTTLPPNSTIVAHGCGEAFPAEDAGDDVDVAANRRVELLVFPEGVTPKASSETSAGDGSPYPAWVDAVSEERTFTPSSLGMGNLQVATDVRVERASIDALEFRLWSTDGVYEVVKTIGQDHVVRGSYVDVLFEGLPKGSFYSLSVTHPDGSTGAVFEDVPYFELAAQTDGLEAVPAYGPEATS